jgi:hypothetical protein
VHELSVSVSTGSPLSDVNSVQIKINLVLRSLKDACNPTQVLLLIK